MLGVNAWRLLAVCCECLETFGCLLVILGCLGVATFNCWRPLDGCCEYLVAPGRLLSIAGQPSNIQVNTEIYTEIGLDGMACVG